MQAISTCPPEGHQHSAAIMQQDGVEARKQHKRIAADHAVAKQQVLADLKQACAADQRCDPAEERGHHRGRPQPGQLQQKAQQSGAA